MNETATNHPTMPPTTTIDRRHFLKTSAAAIVGTAAAGPTAVAAPAPPTEPQPIPTRTFGKTGENLPILAYGGAALPTAWGNPLSTEDRVKLVRYAFDRGIRYFDTASNYMESQPILGEALKGIRDQVFLVSKVETILPANVRPSVDRVLEQLQTDRLEAILIHGTPGLEQMTVPQAMKVHAELMKLRDEGLARFVGFSAHSYFDKALALINSGGFDLCMLSYGHLPRGHDQVFSPRMIALRDECVAKAHEAGMGIAAMKVVGAGVLGAWSQYIVPGFDKARLAQLPGAAIRYVLDDERVHLLVIGMRLTHEIDANLKTLSGDVAYTQEDRALLKEFSAKALESDTMKRMRVD